MLCDVVSYCLLLLTAQSAPQSTQGVQQMAPHGQNKFGNCYCKPLIVEIYKTVESLVTSSFPDFDWQHDQFISHQSALSTHRYVGCFFFVWLFCFGVFLLWWCCGVGLLSFCVAVLFVGLIIAYRSYQALQNLAERVVRSVFPNDVIISNWRGGDPSSLIGRALEIDIYLPGLGLGFEYQVFLTSKFSHIIRTKDIHWKKLKNLT